ncbi:MAG: hypothetical protein KZQ90_05415 [Candidatus Thiodiazotropha sp. (ex Codakia rugifera)]|nr:hypothetical protein [Candidatus Thiodiazotropha sp. (ex Codakia rugifera)]
MPDLATELSELESTLADASTQLTALGGAATDEHLNRVAVIVNALEQARLSTESKQIVLAERDAAATDATNAYFDAIAGAREAITTGGDLSPSVQSALRDQLRTDLGLSDLGELDLLLAEVQSYDTVGSDAVATARAELDTATAELTTAEDDLALQQAALDDAFETLTTLAALASDSTTLAYQQLAAEEAAHTAGRLHEAVIHLQDLTATRDALNAAIALASPGFDANETDSATLTASLDAAWSVARDSYEDALATLVDKQETAFEKQLTLADAEASAQDRAARRLIDATQQVADKQATL